MIEAVFVVLLLLGEEGKLFLHASKEGEVYGFGSYREANDYMALYKAKDRGKSFHAVACKIATFLDPRVLETDQQELESCVTFPLDLKQIYAKDFAYYGIPLTEIPRGLHLAKIVTTSEQTPEEEFEYEITRFRR